MPESFANMHQGYVKVPLSVLAAELFGDGVKVERIVLTTDDVENGTITAIVSGHESLPLTVEGEGLSLVVPSVTHYANGLRSTEFRAFEPKRN